MAPIPGTNVLAFVVFYVGVDDAADVVFVVFHFFEEGVIAFFLVVFHFDVADDVFLIGVANGHALRFRFRLFLDDFIVVVGHHHGRLIGNGFHDLLFALGLLVLVFLFLLVLRIGGV